MEETPKPEDLLPLGINDLLTLSREVKDTIIEILKNDDVSTIVTSPTKVCDSCCMSISFSDEDLLLGSKLHNRPLYVSGYIREQKLNQILIDNGSAVNILPKSTMNQLGILVEELSNNKLVIQGFNQGAQWAIGTVRLEIVLGDLQASTIFHVIDSRTTYKMLLGRPWIHENGMVTSTLHQCFKFYKQGIRKVDVDSKPFTKVESHFADAKFYTKNEDVSEFISTEVPVTKGTFKYEQEMIITKKSNKGDAPDGQQNDEPMTQTNLPEGEYIDSGRQKSSFNLQLHSTFCFSKAKHNCKEGIIYKRNSDDKKIFLQKVKRVDNEPEDEVDVAGCCHVTIEETSDHDIFEEDVEAASLSLEDGGATYQCAMQRIFDDMLHKHIECYVDDLVVKSKKKCNHLKDLKLVLDRLRKYQLRMNPLKCTFGVTSGKFLGFIVRHRGIEVGHSKIDAIQKMPSLKNLHELRRLQGCLAYIGRFISNLAGLCQPFQRLMRKDAVFDWDQSYQNAFDSIKKYLLNPPVLSAPTAGKPLILYIAAQETSLGALLAQENDKDFLADHPVPSNWKLCDELPDEEVLFVESMEPWIMFFDGVTRRSGAGVGIFISSKKHMLLYSFTLGELCLNNVAEYHTLIIGIQMASEFGIKYIELFGNSKLIIKQLPYQYEVKHQDLKPYFSYARRLMGRFDSIILEHIPRSENKKADALANLATALTVSEDIPINISLCQKWTVPSIESQYEEADVISVYAIDEEDWRQPIIDYLEHGKLSTDPRHRAEIRKRAVRFIYYKDTLYRRSYEGLLLRCLEKEESTKALEEAHSGIYSVHQSSPKLQYQLKRIGYYWPTMIHDSMHFAKYYETCQFHANFIHQPPEPLHPTIASWPFEAWGLNLVGPITPKSSAGYSYILAGTNYFSK
ncbi:uncharacterized protein E5676_scaffold157G00320 [Cucumis melo var. makuwa]|uniref:Uncharacterized protein n=1 Tax=Cucumis melo var. makuwa TaxID=1194695 RepID=A0A5A7V671_CUCMM|nr:uncharacterized protein E6C27_scaffold455G00360 [Cucumis melo var. makuwa]TYK06257.1 uncharacterized protein E5676_scaffold157G00320 [Cucumis melo var. makuwa]